MAAPLPTLRRIGNALERDDRLDQVLDETLGHLRAGRRDVAITELTHAVQVAYGYDLVTPQLRAKLDEIIGAGGGFSPPPPRRSCA